MKKSKLLFLLLALVMVMTTFVACQPQVDKYSVEFVDTDNKTVLKTDKVEKDKTATRYTPTKEGYSFVEWYATPSRTVRYDFTKKVTKDIKIYAGFSQYQADTREFYIGGAGVSPILLPSNWGKVFKPEMKLVKTVSTSINEYKISNIDLFEGDQFQFMINDSTAWKFQRGFGYMEGAVKDGVTYFTGEGGLGEPSAKRKNISVAKNGNYTFTLTTYPKEDFYDVENGEYSEAKKDSFNLNPYDKITYVRNGDATTAKPVAVTNYFIKGAGVTNWKDIKQSRELMTLSPDKATYTLKISLNKDDAFMFMAFDKLGTQEVASSKTIKSEQINKADAVTMTNIKAQQATANSNIVALKKGVYTFTFTVATGKLTAVVDEAASFTPSRKYYINGNGGWDHQGKPAYELKAVAGQEGKYEITVTLAKDEAFMIPAGQFDTKFTQEIWFTYEHSKAGTNDVNAKFVGAKDGKTGNFKTLEAGSYRIVVDEHSHSVTIYAA